MSERQSKQTIDAAQAAQSGVLASSASEKLNQQGPRATLRAMRNETEIYAIKRALEESGWNRKCAAKLLSISYRGLLYKIRQHNITPGSVSSLTSASSQEI